MKVVYHIDEVEKWELLSANVKNTIAYDPTVKIVVVANAVAVTLFTKESVNLEKNVEYHICNNALMSRNLTQDDLIEGVEIVPSGVVDLIRLQDANYRYIKP